MTDHTKITESHQNHHNYIYVARNIIHKRKLNLEYATKSIGTDDNITSCEKLKQLQELKECCRDTFKTQIDAFMVDEIQNQHIKFEEEVGKSGNECDVRTIQQFKTAIKQDNSIAFLEKLFHVLYGCFDRKPGWAKTLASTYMKSKKIRYNKDSTSTHPERDKGCFELMAWDAKSEMVKTLQRVGKKSSHGCYVNLMMPKDDKGKRQQRVLGQFYSSMVKHVSGMAVDIGSLPASRNKCTVQNNRGMNEERTVRTIIIKISYISCDDNNADDQLQNSNLNFSRKQKLQ